MNTVTITRRKEEHGMLLFFASTSLVSTTYRLTERWDHYLQKPLVLLFMIGFTCLLVVIVINALRNVLRKGPGLVLDERGIHDGASLIRAGLIPWHELKGVRLTTKRSPLLVLELHDAEAVIGRIGGFKQKMARSFLRQQGSPVVIQTRHLKMDPHELLRLVQERIVVP